MTPHKTQVAMFVPSIWIKAVENARFMYNSKYANRGPPLKENAAKSFQALCALEEVCFEQNSHIAGDLSTEEVFYSALHDFVKYFNSGDQQYMQIRT